MSCPMMTCETFSAISIEPILRPDPINGTLISFYDVTYVWTTEHVPPTRLNEWRKKGDRSIDYFYERHGQELQKGEDTYQFIQQLGLRENHICNDHCTVCCLFNIHKNIRQEPSWFDRKQAQQGQLFFLKHSGTALTAIFHYTLLLGYGFQQLNDILIETHYLSSFNLSLTYRRLVETLQMIVNVVCGDIDNFDRTFADVIRVRLLHGMVRYKIKNSYPLSNDQVPINQEDSLITLLGFSFSVLYCMEERMGIKISDEDKQCYLHLWRYVGWLIGIEEEYLYYLSSYQSARIISESIFYHHYLPSQISKHMVHHSLMSIYMHGAASVSFQLLVGISQRLLGNLVSEELDIHQPTVDRLHFYAIALLFKIFQFNSWLIRLNYSTINNWIVESSKKRLNFLVYSALNKQLRNFALFKNTFKNGRKTFEECPCGYYEKKHGRTIKTNDIGLFHRKQSGSLRPLLQGVFFLCVVFCIIRW